MLNTSDIDENSEADTEDTDAAVSDESGSCDTLVTAGSDKLETSNNKETVQEGEEEEESSEDDYNEETWSGQTLKPSLPSFDGKLCLSDDIALLLPKNPSPIDLFKLFLTPEIVTFIVNQSNLYRTQNSLLKQEPKTEDDLLSLIGFLYYSSTVPLPSKSDYWSSFCRQSFVADFISRDRVDYLLSILHFNDNTVEKDKLQKVEPLIIFFNDRCLNIVHPERNVSIDEQMIGYKGKTAPTSLKQYMPNKPTKRGFKLWAKCGISGFVYEIKIYCGSTSISSNQIPNATLQRSFRSRTTTDSYADVTRAEFEQHNLYIKEFGAASTVVLDFLKHIPLGSRIFVDNYFGSLKLIHKLTDLGYGITCTLRSNRIGQCPIPSEKQMKTQTRGFYQSFVTDDEKATVVVWKDNKTVLLGSNCVGEEPLVFH